MMRFRSPTAGVGITDYDPEILNKASESVNNGSERIKNVPETLNKASERVNKASERIKNVPETLNKSPETVNYNLNPINKQ